MEQLVIKRPPAESAQPNRVRELEKAVAERTAELAKANSDFEALLHIISHDLKEPLRVVENFSRLVSTKYAPKLDDKGQDFLRRIVLAGDRMGRLLDDIMMLARTRRIGETKESVEGAAVIREALHRLEGEIRESGASIHVAEPLPEIHVHRTWAVEAVCCLLSNGLKFARPEKNPEIEIEGYLQGNEAGYAVSDRGTGIASEQMERIFQFFYRAVGREIEGTGAGLAIAREIAERHGGRAWVESREGGGSKFFLTFRCEE